MVYVAVDAEGVVYVADCPEGEVLISKDKNNGLFGPYECTRLPASL